MIVVGGGVIGCSVALELADEGAEVFLLESKERLFDGMSKAGFGSVTPFSDPFFRGAARDFAAHSLDLYRQKWVGQIAGRSGMEINIGDHGLLKLLTDHNAVEAAEDLQRELRGTGYTAELMDRDAVLEMEPNLVGSHLGALWLDEPWIDLEQYLDALDLCVRTHPEITVRCGITILKVDTDANGVSAVSDDQEFLRADLLVACTGLSARPIEGIATPELNWVRGDAMMVQSRSGEPLLDRHVYQDKAFITPRKDGRLLLGATYEIESAPAAELEMLARDTVSARSAIELLLANSGVLPAILDCDVVKAWRGWRPTPTDRLPVLGYGGENGTLIATGFIGLGMTMAPAVAEAVTQLVFGGGSDLIPPEFAPARGSTTC